MEMNRSSVEEEEVSRERGRRPLSSQPRNNAGVGQVSTSASHHHRLSHSHDPVRYRKELPAFMLPASVPLSFYIYAHSISSTLRRDAHGPFIYAYLRHLRYSTVRRPHKILDTGSLYCCCNHVNPGSALNRRQLECPEDLYIRCS